MSQPRPLLKTLTEIRLGLAIPEALVLVILTMASGYWTYLGVTDLNPEATDWFSRAGAAVLAVAVTAALFLFWRAVLLQLPHYTGVRLAVAVPVVIGGAIMVVGISSYLNFTGMVGHEAMRAEMQQQFTALAEETTKATEAAQHSLKIADNIRLQAANYRNIEASERKVGGFTTKPGVGPVQGMIAQVAASFDEAERQAREGSPGCDAHDAVSGATGQLARHHHTGWAVAGRNAWSLRSGRRSTSPDNSRAFLD